MACGDVGGQMLGNSLVIALRALNDSEQAGIAIREEMGDQTQVANFLQDQEFGEPNVQIFQAFSTVSLTSPFGSVGSTRP
jgi:hypothetical protein